MNGMKTAALFAVMMVTLVPCVASEASDAAGQWWGTTTDIPITAGSTFEFSGLGSLDDETTQISVAGDLKQYFTITGTDMKATFPRDLEEGTYNIIIKSSGKEQRWMILSFHVQSSEPVPTGYAAQIPSIDRVAITPIGNNPGTVQITLKTTNVDSVRIDFDDGTATEDIGVRSKVTSVTHRYYGNGLYALGITASNSYGSTQTTVVYNSGIGEYSNDVSEEDVVEEETEKSTPWMLIVLIVAAIVATAIAYFTYSPLAIAAAIVLGLSAGVDYLWFM